MLKRDDIEHLALLARISLSKEEKDEFTIELDSVLSYVGEIATVATEADAIPRAGELRNRMREDVEPYAGGGWSAAIIENAPDVEDGYVKVKQIF